jgi:hypothetical protein
LFFFLAAVSKPSAHGGLMTVELWKKIQNGHSPNIAKKHRRLAIRAVC